MKKTNLLLCLLLIIAAGSVEGQIVFNQPPSGSPQFVYSHWTFTTLGIETTVDQFYVPVRVFLPLRDNLEARVFLANSSNSFENFAYDASASGLSDARIQVNQSLQDDHVIISGGLNLPIGKTRLDPLEEWPVIPILSQDFLEFPARRLGEGFGFNLLVGGATMWGQSRVGGALAYRFLGEYKPYEGSGDYNSGDMASLNVGLDLPKDPWQWTLSAAYTIYGADKLDGVSTFKQSPQLALSGSGTYSSKPHSVTGWLSYVIRGKNTFYDSAETVIDESKLYGNEFSAGARAEYEFAQAWKFMPSVKMRFIEANDFFLGSAKIYSFGGAFGRQFSEQLSASAGFRYFTGSVDAGLTDLTGYQITGNLVYNF